MRWVVIACATLRCPPAAGLRPPPRPPMSSYSTRDQFIEYWSRYKAAMEVNAPGSEYRGLPAGAEEFEAAVYAAYDRRKDLGLTPRFQVTVPPLPASELFVRNAADVACAGWALFQVACSDACGRFSARMLEAMPKSASVQEPGPCDHNGGAIPASRAGLEELAALPHGEYAKLDGAEREHEAAGALWYRLKEDGRRLQEEGELCEAEETLERAERAEAAYKSLGYEAYQQLLDVLCRAGWAGKYYVDRLRSFDSARAKMDESCIELLGEGKDEAALEIVARREQLEAQRLSLLTELAWARGWYDFDGSHYEKDREAGVPSGTTSRLEMTLAATAATSPPRRSKDGSAEVRQLAKLVARLTRATATGAGPCRSAGAPGERAAIAKAFGELEAWLEGTPMTYTLMKAVDSENGVISLVYTLKASEDAAIAHRARVVLLRWNRLRAEFISASGDCPGSSATLEAVCCGRAEYIRRHNSYPAVLY